MKISAKRLVIFNIVTAKQQYISANNINIVCISVTNHASLRQGRGN